MPIENCRALVEMCDTHFTALGEFVALNRKLFKFLSTHLVDRSLAFKIGYPTVGNELDGFYKYFSISTHPTDKLSSEICEEVVTINGIPKLINYFRRFKNWAISTINLLKTAKTRLLMRQNNWEPRALNFNDFSLLGDGVLVTAFENHQLVLVAPESHRSTVLDSSCQRPMNLSLAFP